MHSVDNLSEFKINYPQFTLNDFELKYWWSYYDGILNGFLKRKDRLYYFGWVADGSEDHYDYRIYAISELTDEQASNVEQHHQIGRLLGISQAWEYVDNKMKDLSSRYGKYNYDAENLDRYRDLCRNFPVSGYSDGPVIGWFSEDGDSK